VQLFEDASEGEGLKSRIKIYETITGYQQQKQRSKTLLDGWLGFGTDEGRGKLRKAWGSRTQTLNPGSLNGKSYPLGYSERKSDAGN
jgi:hypothetical protein